MTRKVNTVLSSQDKSNSNRIFLENYYSTIYVLQSVNET